MIRVVVDDLAFIEADAVLRPADAILAPVTPAVSRLDRLAGERFAEQRRVSTGLETGAAVVAAQSPTGERHTVWSASYRHTLKGPDRGKWETDVTPEADAPLMTVDAVVQGVMKRSGEQFLPEKLTANEFRTIVGLEPREPFAVLHE